MNDFNELAQEAKKLSYVILSAQKGGKTILVNQLSLKGFINDIEYLHGCNMLNVKC